VGEVASSNLVVPTIISFIFILIEQRAAVYAQMIATVNFCLLGPFSRISLISLRLPFCPFTWLHIGYRTVAR
jgi:hypothetical protein